jgi:NADPH:quinone reductase-like Zn-dependent oxidoreductase
MKTIVYKEYGSPDVLQFENIEKPTPKDEEVLVKIQSVSANPLDWHLMRGEPFLARLEAGLRKPTNPRLGADLAGIVESVGDNVKKIKIGDAVFGDVTQGAFSEYVCVSEKLMTLKPDSVSFEDAAATPVAGLTALQGLRNAGGIQSGQTVLINGASGGVGTYAVQIAKTFGAEVTGVCSTRNLEMVRSIGADHVVDYTQEDFTQNGRTYDLVFDAVGNRTMSELKRALNLDGRCVVAGFTGLSILLPIMILGPLVSKFDSKKIGMMETAHPDEDDLQFLSELLEAGKVKSVIDRCYPFSETAEAIRYLEKGHARGKVIISIA